MPLICYLIIRIHQLLNACVVEARETRRTGVLRQELSFDRIRFSEDTIVFCRSRPTNVYLDFQLLQSKRLKSIFQLSKNTIGGVAHGVYSYQCSLTERH